MLIQDSDSDMEILPLAKIRKVTRAQSAVVTSSTSLKAELDNLKSKMLNHEQRMAAMTVNVLKHAFEKKEAPTAQPPAAAVEQWRECDRAIHLVKPPITKATVTEQAVRSLMFYQVATRVGATPDEPLDLNMDMSDDAKRLVNDMFMLDETRNTMMARIANGDFPSKASLSTRLSMYLFNRIEPTVLAQRLSYSELWLLYNLFH